MEIPEPEVPTEELTKEEKQKLKKEQIALAKKIKYQNLTEEEKEAAKAHLNELARKSYNKYKDDPDFKARHNKASKKNYEKNSAEISRKKQEKYNKLPPEQKKALIEKMRENIKKKSQIENCPPKKKFKPQEKDEELREAVK